jgi:hypothetical protein
LADFQRAFDDLLQELLINLIGQSRRALHALKQRIGQEVGSCHVDCLQKVVGRI